MNIKDKYLTCVASHSIPPHPCKGRFYFLYRCKHLSYLARVNTISGKRLSGPALQVSAPTAVYGIPFHITLTVRKALHTPQGGVGSTFLAPGRMWSNFPRFLLFPNSAAIPCFSSQTPFEPHLLIIWVSATHGWPRFYLEMIVGEVGTCQGR